jgi:hypothetical protein
VPSSGWPIRLSAGVAIRLSTDRGWRGTIISRQHAPSACCPTNPLVPLPCSKDRLARLEERFAAMAEPPLAAALAKQDGARLGGSTSFSVGRGNLSFLLGRSLTAEVVA